MGQQLYKGYVETASTKVEETISTPETSKNNCYQDDFGFLLSRHFSNDASLDSNGSQLIPLNEIEYVRRIRQHIHELTKFDSWDQINKRVHQFIQDDLLIAVENEEQDNILAINESLSNRNEIQSLMESKMNTTDNRTQLDLYQSSNLDEKEREKQLSCFGIQSLLSILLLLIRATEKHDSIVIPQILNLSLQISQQLPLKSLSSSSVGMNFIDSLKPLVDFIEELTKSEDQTVSKQARLVLLSFAIAKGSLKDLLPWLQLLISDRTNTYESAGIFRQFNYRLNEILQNSDDTGMILPL